MNPYEMFDEQVKKAAEAFRQIGKNEVIRVVSHLDADGISACALLLKLLNNENRKYSVSTVQQLNKEVLGQLASEPYSCFMFTDIGSGAFDEVKEILSGRKVFILDHHSIEGYKEAERTWFKQEKPGTDYECHRQALWPHTHIRPHWIR